LSRQPLPVLTEAQVKLAGPLHPAGKGLKPAVTDRFVACRPSSVVNVMPTELEPPVTTAIWPAGEGVAMTLSMLVAA
jgi:hypothetical protein